MSAPTFGMQFKRTAEDTTTVLDPDFSKILVVETSEDASASEFPLDTPIVIDSGDSAALEALGTGLAFDYVDAINAQLTGLNSSADVTVVRVAEGADVAATCANIVNIIDSLDDIPSVANRTPRIVLAGRTAWRADLDTVNPVITSLQSNLGNILAIAPVDVDDTSMANAIDAREGMSSERLMPIGVAAKVYKGTELVERPLSPFVAGLFVRVDNIKGGKPFDPIANRFLYGLSGLSRNIKFSLLNGATEGQQLLASNIAIAVQGETGVDGSVSDGGYVFIGTDNAQTDELFEQIHQVRGMDFLTVKMMNITRKYLGRKITASMVEAWIKSIAFMLRDHNAAEDIIGYTPMSEMFKAVNNSAEQISLGTLKLDIGIEPCPVFKRADHDIRRYSTALDGLVEEVIASLSTNS
ncbi:phage tail protein [uncultured Cohaesibacter sp.]|uniref:phage tail protein n=1 Tax=uncultured Cohaesibacter sp. TaxID=1002546 RepID=UPI0029C967D6|nr:phage tail protein [uncultured Cohaesibacter sp.]